MVNVSKSAGSFFGGIFNNPGAIIALGVVGALVLFRNDIRGFFGGITEGLGKIGQLPEINIDLPTFEIPGLGGGGTNPPPPDVENTGLLEDPTTCPCGTKIVQDLDGDVSQTCIECEQQGPIFDPPIIPEVQGPPDFSDTQTGIDINQQIINLLNGLNNDPIITGGQGDTIIVGPADEQGFGGGPTFEGGVTTLGDNLVDTLSEVLKVFPFLTASQARNVLEENPGLTPSEFRFVDPFPSSISSAGVDPDQIINNAGDFSGLTPEQIALLLTGGNINNF